MDDALTFSLPPEVLESIVRRSAEIDPRQLEHSGSIREQQGNLR